MTKQNYYQIINELEIELDLILVTTCTCIPLNDQLGFFNQLWDEKEDILDNLAIKYNIITETDNELDKVKRELKQGNDYIEELEIEMFDKPLEEIYNETK